MTIALIIAAIVWVIGIFGMYVFVTIGEAVAHVREPVWFKIAVSLAWPITLSFMVIVASWSNYRYRRYMRDKKKNSQKST